MSQDDANNRIYLQDPCDASPLDGHEGASACGPGINDGRELILSLLSDLAEENVIPELLSENGSGRYHSRIAQTLSESDIVAFQRLVLDEDFDECLAFVGAWLETASFDEVCQRLFARAARKFGEQWERDELSFLDVTIALGKLHTLLHKFAPVDKIRPGQDHEVSIVLANARGEQHSFGLLIVAKYFQSEGWRVTGGPHLETGHDLEALVQDRWFDVVGLSASTTRGVDILQKAIPRIRQASSNGSAAIMVGGNGFMKDPNLPDMIGADYLARDASEAISKAQMLQLRS